MTKDSPPKIKGLDFSEVEIADAKKVSRILQIGIFTEMSCNFNCPYCFTRNILYQRSNNLLALNDYKEIFKQSKILGAKSVLWLGNGEPLLYNRFWEFIDLANNCGLTVILFSNGSLITEKIAQELFSKNVSIYVTLNSFNSIIQDRLVGNIKGAHISMKKGIGYLIKYGFNKMSPSRLGIQSVITKDNINELPDIYRWARKNNIVPLIELILHLRSVPEEAIRRYDVNMKEVLSLFHQLLNIDEKEFSYSWIPTPPYVGKQCDRFYYSITIDAHGDIYPCGGSGLKLGNIRMDSLNKLLNSTIMKKIKRMKEFVEGKCRICEYDCCGCREEAYLKTGNYFGEYSRCWYNI